MDLLPRKDPQQPPFSQTSTYTQGCIGARLRRGLALPIANFSTETTLEAEVKDAYTLVVPFPRIGSSKTLVNTVYILTLTTL